MTFEDKLLIVFVALAALASLFGLTLLIGYMQLRERLIKIEGKVDGMCAISGGKISDAEQ